MSRCRSVVRNQRSLEQLTVSLPHVGKTWRRIVLSGLVTHSATSATLANLRAAAVLGTFAVKVVVPLLQTGIGDGGVCREKARATRAYETETKSSIVPRPTGRVTYSDQRSAHRAVHSVSMLRSSDACLLRL